jgi:hypothetical protein
MDHFCPRCHSGATTTAASLAGPKPKYWTVVGAVLFPYVVFTTFFTPRLPRIPSACVAGGYLLLFLPLVIARRRLRRVRWHDNCGQLALRRMCQSCGELFKV